MSCFFGRRTTSSTSTVVLDGYTTFTGATGDGYVTFFTGTKALAGDNDFYFNRETNQLQLSQRLQAPGLVASSGALNIGTAATSGHSLTTGDVISGGALEVDGVTYADAGVIVTGSNNSVFGTADKTNAVLIGNPTPVGSLTGCTSAGTTTITKATHGLSVAAGDLLHITSCTTAADKGFYRIASTTASTFVVDRALSGSDVDVALTIYQDGIAFHHTDGVYGNWIRGYSHTNKPLQIGGNTLTNPSSLGAGSQNVYIGGSMMLASHLFMANNSICMSGFGSIIIGSTDTGTTTATRIAGAGALSIDDGLHIALSATDGQENNNLIITSAPNWNKNHDHSSVSTNPTLILHSALDPDTNNTRYSTFAHTGTAGSAGELTIGTGSGDVALRPASGVIVADGYMDATDSGIRTKFSLNNVHDSTPSASEITAAFGTASACGQGFIGVINDAGGGDNFYICATDGTNWFFTKMTKAT